MCHPAADRLSGQAGGNHVLRMPSTDYSPTGDSKPSWSLWRLAERFLACWSSPRTDRVQRRTPSRHSRVDARDPAPAQPRHRLFAKKLMDQGNRD